MQTQSQAEEETEGCLHRSCSAASRQTIMREATDLNLMDQRRE